MIVPSKEKLTKTKDSKFGHPPNRIVPLKIAMFLSQSNGNQRHSISQNFNDGRDKLSQSFTNPHTIFNSTSDEHAENEYIESKRSI